MHLLCPLYYSLCRRTAHPPTRRPTRLHLEFFGSRGDEAGIHEPGGHPARVVADEPGAHGRRRRGGVSPDAEGGAREGYV